MTKKAWAKGRNKQYFVCVDEETRKLARELSLEYGVTMKDLIGIALMRWKLTENAKPDTKEKVS